MAINVSFNGATIFKPGSYSKTTIDLGGGFPLGPAGLVGIFGESTSGRAGSEEDIRDNVYSPEQLPEIRAKYGEGPIVDAATFAFAPAADANIPSGAQALYIYKTNASTRAIAAMDEAYASLRSLEYGEGGNRITFKVQGSDETPASIAGSADIADGSDIAIGDTLVIAADGAAAISYTILTSVDKTALEAQLSGAFPALDFVISAGATGKIAISLKAKIDQHKDGNARTIEIQAGTANATFGLTAGLVGASAEASRIITISQKRDLIDEDSTIGGNISLSIGFDSAANDATAATVDVDATNITLTVTGGAEAGTQTFAIASFATLSEIAAAIDITVGWSAEVPSALSGQLNPSVLDQVVAIGALSESGLKPARIKKDASEFNDFILLSQLVDTSASSDKGLPNIESEKAFAGGSKGATSTSSISDALEAFTKIRLNAVVPLMSRDATDDIADGLTDSSSAYTIVGIHQSVKTHLSLMSTTKRRSERQGYLSFKDTFDNSKDRAAELADARAQLAIQDVRQVQANGTLTWFQPWALAVMMSGARGGSPIGLPLTFKFFNVAGIRQTGQSMSTAEEDIVLDFDPDTQTDEAIQAGVTFLESPQSGGFRMVVDNTTYGRDANFVFNRANVLYAADVLAYDLRNQLENIYVGQKNTVNAVEVKSTVESIMDKFLAQGITVQSDDAPNGFKDLVVQIDGSVIRIDIVVKIVEGIDFILNNITIQRKQSAA